MSDDTAKTPAAKSSFAEKAAKAAAIGAGVVAAAAVIPQDELMKTGLPNLWESIKGIAHLNWLRLEEAAKKFRPVAFAWGAKLWSSIKWWALISFALIAAGIEVKTRFGSNVGHVLVAAGTISFVGLGLMLFALSDGIASILFFKIRLAGGILNKVTSIVGVDLSKMTGLTGADAQAKADKFHNKVKLILAGTVVLSFSLLFTMFFPAWSTLGWTITMWAPVAVALAAAIHREMPIGKAITVLFYVTLGLIVAMFVVFLLDRLTGGAIGFAPVQEWMRNVNGSEVLAGLLVLLPLTLLLVGAFAKDKDRKAAFHQSAKYVGIGCAVLGAFLLYKGTISWKRLSGKDAPKAVSEVIEKIENGSIASKKSENAPAPKQDMKVGPQGTTSNGGVYMSAPMSGSGDPMPREEAPTPSKPTKAATHRRASKPLPKEEPKTYSNLTQGVDDLEALGY